MKKIVINACYGGFGLSHKAVMRYAEIKGIKLYPVIDDVQKEIYGDEATFDNKEIYCGYYTKPPTDDNDDEYYWPGRDIQRDDPILIQVIEELGEDADGYCSELKIIEIPDDIEFTIEEYDGNEWVAEKHKTWG